ncbi:dynein light chain Tctex-type 4-like isoform X1 [Xyrauchen texanus]|uniref:dynein light chain Tctex-type 4-like isoform X1 n=2 Tax=Xyrauchen texanus TaxID=154827 RepID=UPI002241947B|nr:dynein light chain Tctex-type 4-like isoform X1 [Xyrauchen texanus]
MCFLTDLFNMANQPLPLSKETLAQFNHSLATEPGASGPLRRRVGSISTRRSSKDQATHRPLHLRGVTGPSSDSSFLSPNVTNSHVSIGKRFSFGGWQQGGRVSFSGLYLHQPIQEIHMENTYRMGPEPGSHFNASRTQQILKATLDSYLDGVCYNPENSSQLCQMLADLVLSKLKDDNPPRYKLVCQVVVGQSSKQGIRIASRSLINSDTDSYTSADFQNHSVFAVAIVHGVYCE